MIKKKEIKEEKKDLQEAINEIKQRFGEGAIMKLKDARAVDVGVISTGSISLDSALGVGGIPRGRVVEIYGIESTGKCVKADTIIFSEQGMLPIAVFGNTKIPEFQKKEVFVYSEQSYEKTSHFYNGGIKPTIKIKTNFGYKLEGTPNHQIRVLDKDGNYLFRRLDALRPMDYIAIQRGQNCFGKGVDLSDFEEKIWPKIKSKMNTSRKDFKKFKITREMAKLIGYMIGDGTCSNKGLNRNNIQISTANKEVEDDIRKNCLKIFGEEPKKTLDEQSKNTKRLQIHNTKARAFLYYAGVGWWKAGQKEIPWSIMCSPKIIVANFLKTLFECDGCAYRGKIEYCSKSKKLIRQIQTVLLNFGIISKIKPRYNKNYKRYYYHLYIDGQKDREIFSKEISFLSRSKQEKLEKGLKELKIFNTNIDHIPNINKKLVKFLKVFREKIRPTNRKDWKIFRDYLPRASSFCQLTYNRLRRILKHFSEGRNLPEYQELENFYNLGFFWDKITHIKPSVAYVFDFTVPSNATFCGNGFVNHNSTLALHICAEAQKKGGVAAFIDAENALDPEYGKRIGVNIDDLLISQPDSGEQALQIVETLIRSGEVDVIVIDSVAALAPKAEIAGEMGEFQIGLQARLMSSALRKLSSVVAKTKTSVIFLNQTRMKIGVMFGCLNYKTKINLSNGTTEWIGRLVNQKKKVEVLSYDWKQGKIVTKQVVDWYRNGNTDKFLQITAYKPYDNGRTNFACTLNHPILTPAGWRKAEDIAVGDKIIIVAPFRLSDFQLEVIRGSLLGDGSLSPTIHKKSSGVRFRLGHGLKQKKYLEWKVSLFKNIPYSISSDKKSIKCDLTPLSELYSLRKEVYCGDYKFLSADILANLTPLSLAVWYMDDGSLDIRNKARNKGRIAIVVKKIHPQSRKILQKLLENRYDIKTRLTLRGKNKQPILIFDQKNTDKFLSLIKKYVHPSMDYKLLPQYRGKFSVRPVFNKVSLKPIAVPVLNIKEKPKTRSMMRFDIQVAQTHNFLADGAIVHNSPETTPGGLALKFYSSVRINLRRVAQIKHGDEIIGSRIRAKIVKNKVAAPFKTTEFDIYYNEGISYLADIVNTGLKQEIIKKAGSWYQYEDTKLGQGMEGAKAFLKENPEIAKKIKKAIIEQI